MKAPETIVNGRSLRVDIESSKSEEHRVTSIVACSSIDTPFHDYDPLAPESTGCNSPGFQSEFIFPSATSLFKVRQRSNALFMRRRLVVRQSPVVYLQVHTGVRQRGGDKERDQKEVVMTAQYRVPEKVLPLSGSNKGGDEAAKDEGNVLIGASVDAQEVLEVVQPGQLKWYEYSGFILGFAALVCCIVAVGLYHGTKRSKRAMRHLTGMGSSSGSYADKRKETARQVVSSWIGSAMEKGVYVQPSSAAEEKRLSPHHPLA